MLKSCSFWSSASPIIRWGVWRGAAICAVHAGSRHVPHHWQSLSHGESTTPAPHPPPRGGLVSADTAARAPLSPPPPPRPLRRYLSTPALQLHPKTPPAPFLCGRSRDGQRCRAAARVGCDVRGATATLRRRLRRGGTAQRSIDSRERQKPAR